MIKVRDASRGLKFRNVGSSKNDHKINEYMQQLSVDEEITQYTRLLLDEKIKGIHRKNLVY